MILAEGSAVIGWSMLKHQPIIAKLFAESF